MRPAYLDNMSWAMAEVYEAVTDRLLINLAKYFPYIRSSGEMRGSFEYQARMLAQIGQVNRESTQIIIDSMAGADAALKSTLEAAIMDALKNEEPKLRHAAEKGFIPNGRIPRPILSPNQMQAFTAYYRQSADKLNLVNTVMLESTQNAYISTVSDITAKIGRTQTILNTGTGEVVTGVSTWNQAVQTSVKKMLDNGLTGFIDHGGHRWSPEAYAAMDIRTTVFNTARDAIWERANDYGCDLYQVSSHNGARPLCFPWQAKIISRNDWTGEVQDIDGTAVHVYAQSETSYGEAAGLFGVNCKHYPMTFIPNFSSLKGEPQSEEENAEAYALSQEQRGLERKLREEKRDLEVMKAQGASEEQIAAQKRRVSIASSKIDEFCDEHELPRRRNRETAPIRATWPENPAAENSPFVERYQGDYIPVNQPTGTIIEYHGNETNNGDYTPEIKRAVEESVKTKDPNLLEVINRTSDKCTIDWVDGEGTDHYTYGSGKITMYTQKYGERINPDEIASTRWHEYFHYMDDAKASGSGYFVEHNGYTFHGITATARQDGQYARAAADDINAFFKRRGIDGTYECVVENTNRWIYKNGVPIDTNDFASCNELNENLLDWLDEASGMKKAYRYLDDIGYPQSPNYNDYFETYFTPKRHTLKTRERYKGAELDFIKANEATENARQIFAETHDMNQIFEEQRVLREEAEAARRMLAPVTDTFDGGAFGAFMSPVCGGHSADYYGYNDNGIREGVANVGACLVTENETTIRGMNDLCPNIYKLISNIITGRNR